MVMDSTVVQEIANQLGMAVDQAGKFIQEQLPNYAALKIIQLSCPLYILGILAFISLIISIVSYLITRNIDNDVCFISGAVFVVCFIIFVIVLLNSLAQIIGWQEYPQAMLIDMALKAVG